MLIPLIENGSVALAIAFLRWGTAILLIHKIRKEKEKFSYKTIGDFFAIYQRLLKPKIYIGTYVTNLHCQILIPVHMNQNKFKCTKFT